MRTSTWGMLAVLAMALTASAEPGRPGPGPAPGPDGRIPPGAKEWARDKMKDAAREQEWIRQWDRNGDGQLDDLERLEMVERAGERRDVGHGKSCGCGECKERRVNQVRELVGKHDKNGDGKIDRSELAEMKKRVEEENAERKERIKRFDQNGDGKISDEEEAAARRQIEEEKKREWEAKKEADKKPEEARRREEMERKKSEIIKRFDKDGDGKLSGEEEAAARRALEEHRDANHGPDCPCDGCRAKRQEILKRFDKDGDGKLSDAEKEAAHAAMKEKIEEKKEAHAEEAKHAGEEKPACPHRLAGVDKAELIKRFDLDEDGSISDEEEAAAKRRLAEACRRECAHSSK